MNFYILTLFPDMVMNGLKSSITGRAISKGIINAEAVDIRDYTLDRDRRVDDYPYGGGAGMLMEAQPVYDAYKAVIGMMKNVENIDYKNCRRPRVVYMTPKGKTFDQKMAQELAGEESLIFLCGHYEGIDERVIDEIVTDRVSIGDYVLTGGELPAMVMIDSISRLVPGVLHNDESAGTEAFQDDLLEYPQYTRPEVWHEKKVPEILMSGDHAKIEKWRVEESVNITKELRPDLYEKYESVQEKVDRHKELSKSIRKMQHHISVSMKEVQK